ncbi:MAG: hypothetical protein H6812_12645 [Phycisphaeraceae bacterium]|nr:hypothetical protein [Phycisphaerales bacterium]MCB9844084.1 hypothetical protein [Phycisphaeraceae bacterium]
MTDESANQRAQTVRQLRRFENGCLVLIVLGMFTLVASAFLVIKTCSGGIGPGGVPSFLYVQDVTVENQTARFVRVSITGDLMPYKYGDTTSLLGPADWRWCDVAPGKTLLVGGSVSNAYELKGDGELEYSVRFTDGSNSSRVTTLLGEGEWRLIIDDHDGKLVLTTERVEDTPD